MTREDYELLAKDPKGFLNQGWEVRNRIKAKQQRIENWKSIATSVTAEIKQDGGFGSSYPKSKIEGCVIKIADLQKELERDILELLRLEKRVQEAINLIPDKNNVRFMLELRHLNCFSWVDVSIGVGRTERWVYTLYKRALDQLREIAEKNLKNF